MNISFVMKYILGILESKIDGINIVPGTFGFGGKNNESSPPDIHD